MGGWGGCIRGGVTRRGRGTPSITHALDIDLVIELWRVLYIAFCSYKHCQVEIGLFHLARWNRYCERRLY